MQLTMYTDYALRVLIALGAVSPNKLTVGEIGRAYGISENHLLKVVQKLSALGYVQTLRGKSGGVRLAKAPEDVSIGGVVRQLEPELGVVACLRADGVGCTIAPVCQLKRVLRDATEGFLKALDDQTLSDLVRPTRQLQQLLKLAPPEPRPPAALAPVARG